MIVRDIYNKTYNGTICRVIDESNGNSYGFLCDTSEKWLMDLDVKHIAPDIINGNEQGLCIFVSL